MSQYTSRTGSLSAPPEKVFAFITDIRNFGSFVPPGYVKDWMTDGEYCSFNIPVAGEVSLKIDRKEPYTLVSYRGVVMKNNDFEILVRLFRNENNLADATVEANVQLNPFLRMAADGAIKQFLGRVVDEMERFRSW